MRKNQTPCEFVCKKILESIEPNKYSNLVYLDSPDFQSDKVGLEVTEICDKKHKEMSGNFRNILNKKGNLKRQYNNIKNNGGDIVFCGCALATPKIINADKLFEYEYRMKLKKLNNTYKLKSSNEIILFSDIKRPFTEEEKKNIIKTIIHLNATHQICFDVIYIIDECTLLKFCPNSEIFLSQNISKFYHKAIIEFMEGANKWIKNFFQDK